MWVIVGLIAFAALGLFCICTVAGRCSREEEDN